MSEQEPELEAFSKFIVAVEPWLGEVVLVGGWAHRLYRLDPRARKLDYLPLTTLDGDVAVPPKLKKEESTVRKRLLQAGFEEEFIGEDRPPATHYHYGKRGGFYAEFLAPLEGSEYDRNGKRKATKEVNFKTAGFNRSPTPPLVILTHLAGEYAFCCCTVVACLVLDRSRGLFEALFRG